MPLPSQKAETPRIIIINRMKICVSMYIIYIYISRYIHTCTWFTFSMNENGEGNTHLFKVILRHFPTETTSFFRGCFRYQIHGCFRKLWYHQIIHFNRVFPLFSPSILGVFPLFLETSIFSLRIIVMVCIVAAARGSARGSASSATKDTGRLEEHPK